MYHTKKLAGTLFPFLSKPEAQDIVTLPMFKSFSPQHEKPKAQRDEQTQFVPDKKGTEVSHRKTKVGYRVSKVRVGYSVRREFQGYLSLGEVPESFPFSMFQRPPLFNTGF